MIIEEPPTEFTVMSLEGVAWDEIRPQIHADGRAVRVRRQLLERSSERQIMLTVYEPDLVLRQHTHTCDQITHLVEGEFMAGDKLCKAPAVLVLPKGALFGPVITGSQGATLLEIFLGPSSKSLPADPEGFKRLLDEKGITLAPSTNPYEADHPPL